MDFQLPEIGEGVYEAELVQWLVKPGDHIKHGQNLIEVMTDKATMEVPAPFSGTIQELRAEAGEQIRVGQVILTYTPAGKSVQAPTPVASASVAAPASTPVVMTPPGNGAPARMETTAPHAIKAAPSIRYLARKLGIDLARIRGSGPEGRILVEDVSTQLKMAATPVRQAEPEPRPDYGKPGTRMKLHGLRRKIAEHMVLAKRTIPHYTYVDECDVTELVQLRSSLRDTYSQAGLKLTYLTFIIKAAAGALKDVPLVNAWLDETAGEIVLHDRYHVGVAVATPAGLIVPVIHDADRKDLAHIAQELERLSTDARLGKNRLEDLRGGTFTVTSIGNIGGLFSTPVINHPEVAIVGIGKVVKRPIFDAANNVRPVDMMYLSFSFDHRVVDGAVGAAFGNALIKRLQSPATLLLSDKLL